MEHYSSDKEKAQGKKTRHTKECTKQERLSGRSYFFPSKAAPYFFPSVWQGRGHALRLGGQLNQMSNATDEATKNTRTTTISIMEKKTENILQSNIRLKHYT